MKSIVIRVYGIVQGVGFRPFTARTARELGLTGSVANKGSYVEIHAQGEQEALDLFLDRLQTQAPERAAVLRIDREEIDRECIGGMGRFGAGESCGADCEAERRSGGSEGGFFIIESERERGDIFVSPDIAMCPQCEAELTDASNRRWRHPFINCTACGPRLTILEAMPYDRERTSMKMFPMCRACASEYRDPRSRRYDAQPVCCPDCGPQVYLLERETAEEETFGCETLPGLQAESVQRTECGPQAESVQWKKSLYGAAAIRAARAAIMEGKIVAVKGIGGFHLCCDARNEVAVQRLRERKHRPVKPFAVMMRDLETVEQECVVEPAMLPLLTGHEKPILLLEKREDSECAESKRREQSGREGGFPAATRPLSAKIAPGNPKIGVMLPYAPLQTLLFCGDEEECGSGKKQECESGKKQECESGKNRERENRKDNRKDYEMKMTDALVMTSGNVSGAPIARTDEDAVRELGGFCDLILSHDREIRIRADDSVADWYDGAPYLIRRSRGYAPLPVMLREGEGQAQRWRGAVLAAGGELKNTFCVAKNQLFYPSPYVGDMGDLRTVEALRETAARLCDLLETRPDVIACDLHPAYNTTALAEEIARRQGAVLFPVQHHFAHILSCMAENGVAAGEEVIGAAMDGTGYGADGTIWGGEFLRAGYGGYERLGCIRPFPQVGGDAAAREGWRVAVSMLGELFGDGKSGAKQDEQEVLHITGALGLCSAAQAQTIWRMARSGINTVRSTSAGRLFDAVSAILGIRLSSTYEGEAACFLQFAAQRYERENPRQAAQIARESRGQESGCFEADGAAAQEVRAGGADRYPEQESRGAEDLFTLGTGGIVRRMTEGRLAGEDTGELAYRFHCLFAEQIAEGCLRCAKQTGLSVCALSGGVFQNTLLLMKTEAALTRAGLRVLRHHLIPANDGGIALGQAAAAMYAQSGQKSGVLY